MQTLFPDPTIAGLRITDYGELKDSWQKGPDWFASFLGFLYSLKRKLMANPTQKSKERIPKELQQSNSKCITV